MGEETKDTATFEDKFRITVDKNVNWDASEVADPDGDGDKNTGYVQILKFTPATTGSASVSRATPTTTATRSRRSRSKLADQARGVLGDLRPVECGGSSIGGVCGA